MAKRNNGSTNRKGQRMRKKLTMLIVDEAAENRNALTEIFQDDYQVLLAEDGAQALTIVRTQKVDLVILDVYLSVERGFDVIETMKHEEGLSHIPIVVKTAMSESIEIQALEAGADEFIHMPRNPRIIRQRVNNIAQKYVLEREQMRSRLEEEQTMNQDKELFLARMSHEFRTPINGILGITQLTHPREASAERAMKKIRSQAEYLQALVNDILDMAAIDNHKFSLHEGNFFLNQIVSEVSDLFFSQCRQKKVRFQFKVSNITHENLIGDGVRIKQVLINLLSNALKFTEESGTIEVCVSEQDQDEKLTLLGITVKDTGCGISAEALERIWRPFEQESHLDGRYYGGSGLGLPITKSIVESMKGTIEVTSAVGEGTQFEIHLPMKIGQNVAPAGRKFRSLKVFLVNNDEIASNYMKAILTRLGIHYDEGVHEEEIMDTLKKAYERGEGYDICFICWQMPDGFGRRLTERVRSEFDFDTLKIVTSSYHAEEFERDMRIAGADYILKKPVLQSQVYELMSEICRIPETSRISYAGYDFSGKRVLLAEDNAVNAEVLTGFLNAVHLEVEAVANGQEAVMRFEESEVGYYDAILLDINMPILNGYEAAKKIRSGSKPNAKDIPMIAVTANVFSKDAVKVHEAGMNANITKPVDRSLLYQTIAQYI